MQLPVLCCILVPDGCPCTDDVICDVAEAVLDLLCIDRERALGIDLDGELLDAEPRWRLCKQTHSSMSTVHIHSTFHSSMLVICTGRSSKSGQTVTTKGLCVLCLRPAIRAPQQAVISILTGMFFLRGDRCCVNVLQGTVICSVMLRVAEHSAPLTTLIPPQTG